MTEDRPTMTRRNALRTTAGLAVTGTLAGCIATGHPASDDLDRMRTEDASAADVVSFFMNAGEDETASPRFYMEHEDMERPTVGDVAVSLDDHGNTYDVTMRVRSPSGTAQPPGTVLFADDYSFDNLNPGTQGSFFLGVGDADTTVEITDVYGNPKGPMDQPIGYVQNPGYDTTSFYVMEDDRQLKTMFRDDVVRAVGYPFQVLEEGVVGRYLSKDVVDAAVDTSHWSPDADPGEWTLAVEMDVFRSDERSGYAFSVDMDDYEHGDPFDYHAEDRLPLHAITAERL